MHVLNQIQYTWLSSTNFVVLLFSLCPIYYKCTHSIARSIRIICSVKYLYKDISRTFIAKIYNLIWRNTYLHKISITRLLVGTVIAQFTISGWLIY